MQNLAADEKATLVIIYTMNMLVRGEIVTKERMRVGIWPRSQGVPNLVHIFKPNILLFGGGAPKSFSMEELFVPTTSMIGFHMALPSDEPLDYDERELNRSLEPLSLLLGTFKVKGKIRISSAASLATSLEVLYNGWLSIYDAEITNLFLPQMPTLQTQLLLVHPGRTNFMN